MTGRLQSAKAAGIRTVPHTAGVAVGRKAVNPVHPERKRLTHPVHTGLGPRGQRLGWQVSHRPRGYHRE